LIAPIFGAISGAAVMGAIQFPQWLLKKKSVEKAVQVGLYLGLTAAIYEKFQKYLSIFG
jgi:hypothetical protein